MNSQACLMWRLKMDKKEIKKLMTDLAKGKITQKEVDEIIGKKEVEEKPKQHTRKRSIK